MRMMSFSLTTAQFVAGEKDVTRRMGWRNLKKGDRFMTVRKAMGLQKGEKVERLGECEVVSNTTERLSDIVSRPIREGSEKTEMAREGFPDLTASAFVVMFCSHMKCVASDDVQRIEFKRIGGVE